MRQLINKSEVEEVIKADMQSASDETIEQLVQQVVSTAEPLVFMLIRQTIIDERDKKLEESENYGKPL